MEILAPAGSRESLEAAVRSGADAVYMGGNGFQARAFSAGVGDLRDAVAYAHSWGSAVHFTLNTLFLDRETAAFLDQAEEAAAAGVDAFIVADLGAVELLKAAFPSVPLHASTQLSIRSPQSARAYADLGFSRLVLARETPADEVREICRIAGCEVEVFCHGALCVCGSGRCLMSSLAGGRSANRGACAQPCRMQYTLADQAGYFLNTRDLSMANEIDLLRSCGVTSLKIEGRMKGPLYTAAAVRAYREAVDTGHVSDEAMDALVYTFSRGGFTTGAFGQDDNRFYPSFPGHTGRLLGPITDLNGTTVRFSGREKPNPGDTVAPAGADQTAVAVKNVRKLPDGYELILSAKLNASKGALLYKRSDAEIDRNLKEQIRTGSAKTKAEASFVALRYTPMRLTISLPDGTSASAVGPVPEDARTRPADPNTISAQIRKTGDTPFEITDVKVDLDNNLSIPKSVINAMRRDAIEEAVRIRTNRSSERMPVSLYVAGEKNARRPSRIACLVHTRAQAQACMPLADIMYVPTGLMHSFPDAVPILSTLSSGSEIEELLDEKPGAFLTGCMLPDMKGLICNADFNVTNSFALNLLAELGAARITLSQELNTSQIRDLVVPPRTELEVIAYGHQILMLTENCPVPCDKKRCRVRAEKLTLDDRTGRSFRLLPDHKDACRVQIVNALPLWSADIMDSIFCDVVRLEFTNETAEECASICQAYKDALSGTEPSYSPKEYTRGHLRRGLRTN